jgi:hypothetical protein
MTWQEEQEREQAAREEALLIGGLLAVLLGLRAGTRPIIWDSVRKRFTVDGRAVSITTIRRLLAKIETSVGARLSTFTDNLESGRWTPEQWQRETSRSIGSAHVLAGALAVGSIYAAARDRDVQARIISEERYADNFGSEVKAGKAGSVARIKARAKSYLLPAIITFSVIEQIVRTVAGQKEAMRVRRASESCPGCVAYSYRWIPIAEMPRIGSLNCGGRCRCFLKYR